MSSSVYGKPLIIPNGESPIEMMPVSMRSTDEGVSYDERFVQDILTTERRGELSVSPRKS